MEIPTASSTQYPEDTRARAEVEARKPDIREEVEARRRDAEVNTNVTRDESGTLAPKTSLLKDAARQAARDVRDTFDDLKSSAKDLLNKK